MAVDKPGVLAKISGVLAKFGISIASVTQKERRKAHVVPIVMIIHDAKERQLRQALEIIRNRIDQFGVSEPEITLQGTDRILVQLPGVRDPQRAINLIGQTALLEFKLVDEEGDLDEALKGNVPPGDMILYQRSVDPQTRATRKIPFLLKEKRITLSNPIVTVVIFFRLMVLYS
jgi:preprotein translocase subunit SecD